MKTPRAFRSFCICSPCTVAVRRPYRKPFRYRVQAERQTHNARNLRTEFDLAHCIALAGCSFESYRDPETLSELSQVSSNGTVASYTDKEFVAEHFDGLLEVHLQCANNLPSRDFLGKSDPYVVLNVNESSAKSSIKAQTLDPVWNEVFYLYVKDQSSAILTIRAFDADALKADDSLGVAMFPLKGLSNHESLELDLPLVGDGEGGMLYATLKLLPFDNVEEMGLIGCVDGFEEEAMETAFAMEEVSKAWKALAVMAGKRAEEAFDPVCFIENTETDTQVWVYKNSEKKECVVAFRGTEQIKWKDLATDANIDPAMFDIERSTLNPSLITAFNQKSSKALLVHRGFLTAYDSVKSGLFSTLEMITGKDSEWTIYTTGHSLGGALATLCAFELVSRWLRNPPEVKMYNFGSPRVGNQTFADEFNGLVSESWRIVSKKDLITTVPRLAGYRHVQQVVMINKDGSLVFEDGDRRDVFEGVDVQDILDEVSAMVNDEARFEKVGKMVLDHEMELVSRLIDGSGLDEHMENNYLACLQCSIDNSISSDS